MPGYRIGVDVGGTKLAYGLFDEHFSLVATAREPSAAELPAGLFIAMIVLGEPLGVIEWLGVVVILAGVCLAQVPALRGARAQRPTA